MKLIHSYFDLTQNECHEQYQIEFFYIKKNINFGTNSPCEMLNNTVENVFTSEHILTPQTLKIFRFQKAEFSQ